MSELPEIICWYCGDKPRMCTQCGREYCHKMGHPCEVGPSIAGTKPRADCPSCAALRAELEAVRKELDQTHQRCMPADSYVFQVERAERAERECERLRGLLREAIGFVVEQSHRAIAHPLRDRILAALSTDARKEEG